MVSVMGNSLDQIKNLKILAQSQSCQGQYEIAAKTLNNGINTLESALADLENRADKNLHAIFPAAAEGSHIAAELADLYGILGGVRRKQGVLTQAIAAYDQGYRYESDPRYGVCNSYNRLNRLITRILMHPESLSDANALQNITVVEFIDVPQALKELQADIKKQLDGARSNDLWAAGDLVFTCALNGDDQGAVDAFQRFELCSPPPDTNAYDTYITSINAVAGLNTPRKDSLNKATALFANRMKSALIINGDSNHID